MELGLVHGFLHVKISTVAGVSSKGVLKCHCFLTVSIFQTKAKKEKFCACWIGSQLGCLCPLSDCLYTVILLHVCYTHMYQVVVCCISCMNMQDASTRTVYMYSCTDILIFVFISPVKVNENCGH